MIRKKLFVRLAVLLLCIQFISLSGYAQPGKWVKSYINSIINDTTSASEPRFIAYPTLAYSPETKWEIGLSALYVYYAQRDTTNRLSEINAFTFITLENQYGLWLDHALYSDKSNWFYLGRFRYQQFPLLYYGIGPDTPAEELAQVDANSLQLRERVLRKIYKGVYLGLGFDLQRLTSVEFEQIGDEPILLPTGYNGSTNVGLGLGLVFDQRHNVLNVREGFFGETGFLRYSDKWGSKYDFTNYFLDARYFQPMAKNNVLATQFFAATNTGNVPFNQLALMGGESLMRGYYLGRYRDKSLLASQIEYRFLPFSFSKRLGASAFFGAGTVAPSIGELSLSKLKVAGGAGLRFLLFPKKDVFTRLDLAFTEEGNGVYFFIGEAF